jgi:transposase
LNAPVDPLNLPNLRTLRMSMPNEHQYLFVCETVRKRVKPCCAAGRGALVRNGTKSVRCRDLQLHRRFVEIQIRRQRFRCRNCGATVFEDDLPIVEAARATERLLRDIVERGTKETFAALGRHHGLSENTVGRFFRLQVTRLIRSHGFETPRVIGIDEKKVSGALCAVIANVEHRTMLEMLPGRREDTLLRYFADVRDLHRVEVWCQDLYEPYRRVARQVVPKAQIVVDKFHFLRLGTLGMEAVISRVRETLPPKDRKRLDGDKGVLLAKFDGSTQQAKDARREWFERLPILGAAYEAKEGMQDVYHVRSSQLAGEVLDAWHRQIPGEIRREFRSAIAAYRSWRSEIVAHLDHPSTTGYVESLNRFLGDLIRASRGMSFDVLRAKALLSHGVYKIEQPKFVKSPRPEEIGFAMPGMAASERRNWGASFERIVRHLGLMELSAKSGVD